MIFRWLIVPLCMNKENNTYMHIHTCTLQLYEVMYGHMNVPNSELMRVRGSVPSDQLRVHSRVRSSFPSNNNSLRMER